MLNYIKFLNSVCNIFVKCLELMLKIYVNHILIVLSYIHCGRGKITNIVSMYKYLSSGGIALKTHMIINPQLNDKAQLKMRFLWDMLDVSLQQNNN